MKKYKVAIIGAGTAGLSARREVARITDDYIVIDSGPIGTTCARVGCMPSKVLLQVANDFHRRKKLSQQGVLGGENLAVNGEIVMKHVRLLRDRFVSAVIADMKSWSTEHLVQKHARFIDQNILDLDGDRVFAEKIIIATGSRPVVPDKWKAYSRTLTDTNSVFELATLPRSIAVIGLGAVGIELGQAFARLGVSVIGYSPSKALGGISDPELQNYAFETMRSEFSVKHERVETIREGKTSVEIVSKDGAISVEKILLAMGRNAFVKELDLKNLNVEMDGQGLPVFDPRTLKIHGTSVYLAGDANNEQQILHEVADDGRIAGYNAVREVPCNLKRRTPIAITFTSPNIAVVGQKFSSLVESHLDFIVGKASFEGQGRAIIMLEETGALHVYAEKKGGKIVGAELFAPHGEHLAHIIAWAIEAGLTAKQALSNPFYHPVIEESLRTALQDLERQVIDNAQ